MHSFSGFSLSGGAFAAAAVAAAAVWPDLYLMSLACVCGVLGVFTELPVDELSLCLWGCAFTELPAAVMVCLVLSPSCLLLVLSPAAAQGLKSRKKAPERNCA